MSFEWVIKLDGSLITNFNDKDIAYIKGFSIMKDWCIFIFID